MTGNSLSAQVGHRISLPGHFDEPVVLKAVRLLGTDGSGEYEFRIRLPDGAFDEAIISSQETASIRGQDENGPAQPVDSERLRLLIESARIRLAYAYDRQLAVALSSIRTLPHQIDAVYLKMLLRLPFPPADDRGPTRQSWPSYS